MITYRFLCKHHLMYLEPRLLCLVVTIKPDLFSQVEPFLSLCIQWYIILDQKAESWGHVDVEQSSR